MTPEEAQTQTPGQLQDEVTRKAVNDPAFRERLTADPRAVLESEMGISLPSSFSVKVVQDSFDTAHLVLPPAGQLGGSEMELVAGGGWNCNCYNNCDENNDSVSNDDFT